jgi:hypothetical protein
VAASGSRELAGDGAEDFLHFIAEPDQDGDRDDGNKSEDQGILDESLAPLAFSASARMLRKFHHLILTIDDFLSARRRMKIT